jgi:hypothetical protein
MGPGPRRAHEQEHDMPATQTAAGRYNPEFPEAGNWWDLIDSVSLSRLAERLSNETWDDQRTALRLKTPGLRVAMRLVAEAAGVVR